MEFSLESSFTLVEVCRGWRRCTLLRRLWRSIWDSRRRWTCPVHLHLLFHHGQVLLDLVHVLHVLLGGWASGCGLPVGPQPGAGDVGLAAPAVERTLVAVKPRGKKTRVLPTNSFFLPFFQQLTLTVALIIAWSRVLQWFVQKTPWCFFDFWVKTRFGILVKICIRWANQVWG